MITVNLRPDLKRKRARRPMQGLLEGVRGLGSRTKDPLLLLAVVSWVAVVGWLGFVFLGTTRELSALEPQLEQSRAENKRFKTFLAEKRHQETIRDSLVSQIGTIRRVDGDRYVWAHLLDEVTRALPAYTRRPGGTVVGLSGPSLFHCPSRTRRCSKRRESPAASGRLSVRLTNPASLSARQSLNGDASIASERSQAQRSSR